MHLELHTGDLAGAREFYAGLCGWRRSGSTRGARLVPRSDMGGGLGGGIVECAARGRCGCRTCEVADVGEATERARELGATVLLEPREGPAGWRSVVAAPAAGELAFWQPKRPRA